MYGTIAHMRIKPGKEGELKNLLDEQARTFESGQVPGFIASYGYRMDEDAHDCYMAVLFANKETYRANAESPEQDARYRRLLALLEHEPEWHDGEVVFALGARVAV